MLSVQNVLMGGEGLSLQNIKLETYLQLSEMNILVKEGVIRY